MVFLHLYFDLNQTQKECISGVIAGMSSVLIGQPFDFMKIRMVNNSNISQNMTDCFKETIKTEGIKAFYYGTIPPLIGTGIFTAIRFGLNERFRRFYEQRGGKLRFRDGVYCGAISGCVGSIIQQPAELIRIKLQVKKSPYKNFIQCCIQLKNQYGMKIFSKGISLCLVRDTIGLGFYFGIYQHLKRQFNPNDVIPWIVPCIGGGISGLISWTIIYPIDAVKSKIQGDCFQNPQYRGNYDCICKTFQREGYKGFYKGIFPCQIRAIPVNSCIFLVYEKCMQQLSNSYN